MQKKLIALAIAGAFAAPAFAATSNVEVYGQVNLAVDFTNTDSGLEDAEKSVVRVSNNASRLGFKGTEDLGGGLSAIWQIESGFDADVTATQFTSRNTFIGLSSKSFGTIKVGKHDTPYKSSTVRLDVFGDTLGDYNALVGSMSAMPLVSRSSFQYSNGNTTSSYNWAAYGNTAFDLRESNTITYETPNFSGFSAAVQYGARNESGASAVGFDYSSSLTTVSFDSKLWSVSASYANGPLFITAAWEKHEDVLLNFSAVSGSSGGTSSLLVDETAWKIGAAYTIGNLTAGLLYEKIKSEGAELDGDSFAGIDHKTWYASVAYKMGNITLKGAYARATENCSGCNDGARQWTVGADYDLSKRTKVFALYTSLKADEDGLWTLGGNGTSGGVLTGNIGGGNGNINESGTDPKGFSLGMKHSF